MKSYRLYMIPADNIYDKHSSRRARFGVLGIPPGWSLRRLRLSKHTAPPKDAKSRSAIAGRDFAYSRTERRINN